MFSDQFGFVVKNNILIFNNMPGQEFKYKLSTLKKLTICQLFFIYLMQMTPSILIIHIMN